MYEIDLRLPIEVLRKAPFTLVGPDFRFLPIGVLLDQLDYGDRRVQRLNPLTLSRRTGRGDPSDLIFSFLIHYVNDKGELVAFLTHPICLTNLDEGEALEAFLVEAEKFAALNGSHVTEVELHDRVEGPVSYPTSLSPVSYELARAELLEPDASILRERGYRDAAETYCFERDISELERGTLDKRGRHENCVVVPVNPQEYALFRDRGVGFKVKSFWLTRFDKAFQPISLPNLPFFEGTSYLARKRSRWTLLKGADEGYMHWSPNILEPFTNSMTPYPLLFPEALEDHSYTLGRVNDWGLSTENSELLGSLLCSAVGSMRERGIGKVQFGYVDANEEFLSGFLRREGFRPVHRVRLLRRRLMNPEGD